MKHYLRTIAFLPTKQVSLWLDRVSYVFAAVASVWLAWIVFREGWQNGAWWFAGLFVFVWAIIAYLALPRLHLILSSIYVPNYFFGRTRTGTGLLGDPVNVGLMGTEATVHAAMRTAGWTLADEITPKSVYKIIISTITRRSYPEAPVSALLLFGRRHDFAYQQEVDGSPGKRHHVRFWRCPDGWLLPGGHRVDWLAAGTYDKSVGLSLFTLQITHKIDENTDEERDHIVNTVVKANAKVSVAVLKDFSSGYHARNGGGDAIKTDGDLPIIDTSGIPVETVEQHSIALALDATATDSLQIEHETILHELWSKRPPQILLGSILVGVTVAITAVQVVVDLFRLHALRLELAHDILSKGTAWQGVSVMTQASWLFWLLVAIEIMIMTLEGMLVIYVLRGSNRVRLFLLLMASLLVFTELVGVSISFMTLSAFGSLATTGLHIAIILLFSSEAARQFTTTHSYHKRKNVHG